jgi:PTH1 family peptidyl-tRNA hydrolase
MKLIVGLGNPGDKYSSNRHNVGFMLVDRLAEKLGLKWEDSSKFKAKIAKKDDLILLKPMDFMNNSGEPVSLAMNFYKVSSSDLVVVHDDIDLDFEDVKKQLSSGSAGHKGVESIISNLGTKDFWRIRVGVGRPVNAQPVESFVLSNFSEEELNVIKKLDISSLTD